jgi:hypothetical protein
MKNKSSRGLAANETARAYAELQKAATAAHAPSAADVMTQSTGSSQSHLHTINKLLFTDAQYVKYCLRKLRSSHLRRGGSLKSRNYFVCL